MSITHYVVQREPRWFDRPGDFVPECWSDGLLDRIPRYAHMPFGGPRFCLGPSFAQLEMRSSSATIAQRRRLFATASAPASRPSLTLRPADSMVLRIAVG